MFNRSNTTKGLFLGKPEAEAETSSVTDPSIHFFKDYMHIDDNIQNGRFIISGRKGSGKSAYAKWLCDCATNNNDLFCCLVKHDEIKLESVLQSSSQCKELKYEALFEWVILVRLVKLVVNSNIGTYLKQYKAIKEFYSKNAGFVDIDKYTISEILENKEINFAPLKRDFGFMSRFFSAKLIKAPFYQMISPLREIITEILHMDIYRNIKYYVIFDDLDIRFNANCHNDCEMLMSLIRIAKRYNTEYLNSTHAKVLILLRDDIGDRLEGIDSDKNKIFASYEFCINWYKHDHSQQDENNILLKQFINRRLQLAFDKLGMKYNTEDPWKSFVQEYVGSDKSSFKRILNYTFYLPRDFILIFNDIGNQPYKLPLSRDNITQLLRDYSKVKKQEIADELSMLYDTATIKKIFECLKLINGKGNATYTEVKQFFISENLNVDIFEVLINYSIIIPVNKDGYKFYKYREQNVSMKYEEYTYELHRILKCYFSTYK